MGKRNKKKKFITLDTNETWPGKPNQKPARTNADRLPRYPAEQRPNETDLDRLLKKQDAERRKKGRSYGGGYPTHLHNGQRSHQEEPEFSNMRRPPVRKNNQPRKLDWSTARKTSRAQESENSSVPANRDLSDMRRRTRQKSNKSRHHMRPIGNIRRGAGVEALNTIHEREFDHMRRPIGEDTNAGSKHIGIGDFRGEVEGTQSIPSAREESLRDLAMARSGGGVEPRYRQRIANDLESSAARGAEEVVERTQRTRAVQEFGNHRDTASGHRSQERSSGRERNALVRQKASMDLGKLSESGSDYCNGCDDLTDEEDDIDNLCNDEEDDEDIRVAEYEELTPRVVDRSLRGRRRERPAGSAIPKSRGDDDHGEQILKEGGKPVARVIESSMRRYQSKRGSSKGEFEEVEQMRGEKKQQVGGIRRDYKEVTDLRDESEVVKHNGLHKGTSGPGGRKSSMRRRVSRGNQRSERGRPEAEIERMRSGDDGKTDSLQQVEDLISGDEQFGLEGNQENDENNQMPIFNFTAPSPRLDFGAVPSPQTFLPNERFNIEATTHALDDPMFLDHLWAADSRLAPSNPPQVPQHTFPPAPAPGPQRQQEPVQQAHSRAELGNESVQDGEKDSQGESDNDIQQVSKAESRQQSYPEPEPEEVFKPQSTRPLKVPKVSHNHLYEARIQELKSFMGREAVEPKPREDVERAAHRPPKSPNVAFRPVRNGSGFRPLERNNRAPKRAERRLPERAPAVSREQAPLPDPTGAAEEAFNRRVGPRTRGVLNGRGADDTGLRHRSRAMADNHSLDDPMRADIRDANPNESGNGNENGNVMKVSVSLAEYEAFMKWKYTRRKMEVERNYATLVAETAARTLRKLADQSDIDRFGHRRESFGQGSSEMGREFAGGDIS